MQPQKLAWDALSNSMRLYAESSLKFKSLFAIDAEEAICNHDRAFDAKLEGFHRLYDVTKGVNGFDYFGHAETSLLIVLRNALHHRDHSLFTSWNSMMYGEGGFKKKAGALYLLASYEGVTAETSKYFLRFPDFFCRLSHPTIRNSAVLKSMWERELSFGDIAARGTTKGYPDDQVYVDVIPIFIAAMQRVAGWMATNGIISTGFDGETYAAHFTNMDPVDLTRPNFSSLRITD